jgi:NIMA (never in mitosis gene a)-related kinase
MAMWVHCLPTYYSSDSEVHQYVDEEQNIIYILMEVSLSLLDQVYNLHSCQYCGGGDLGSVIKAHKRDETHIPEKTIWCFLVQILLALHHCHFPEARRSSISTKHRILHRDIKPQNGTRICTLTALNSMTQCDRTLPVLLAADHKVKLGDFGLSKVLGDTTFASTILGVRIQNYLTHRAS